MNDLDRWLSTVKPNEIEKVDSVKKTYKVDAFKTLLPALNKRDKYFYRNLSPEEQDSVSMWLMMRILSSSTGNNQQPYTLMMLNDIVNVHFSRFNPQKTMGYEGHKELQWMLLCLASPGKSGFNKFIKAPKGMVKNKLEMELTKFYPNLKYKDLELLINLNTPDELKQFFIENGYDNKTIDDIFEGSF